jgi:hypothetical protein
VPDLGEGFIDVGRGAERVPEHRKPPARPQHLRRFGRSGHRVHPVPGLPGDDSVECPACGVPVLELRHLGFDPEPPRQAGHPRVGVDPEHAASGRLELPGRDTGAAAHIQHAGAGAGGGDRLHHGGGVAGPGPVITPGVRAERLRYLPCLMRLIQ